MEDEKFIQSRRALRKSKLLNQLEDVSISKNDSNNDNENEILIFEIDPATEEAARNVASTYDRISIHIKA